MKTHATGWLINDGDEDINIVAYVYDHQEDIEYVHLNLMPFGGPYMTPMYDDGDHNDGDADDGIFCAEDITTTVPPGDYDLWVSCKSAGTDLMTYQKVRVKVSDVNPYGGDPDYGRMYDDTQVKRLDISVEPGDWEDMQIDLLEQLELPWNERDYLYVECTVEFEEFTWEHVGIRYKGNSSIQYPVQQNRKKLPFRLDFDEFEDEYPETQNQRIWGLKWMVFGNNFNDPTMLREKITYDLHRQTGIAASRVAHYRLFIDHGEGSIYFGLYTSPEVVDKRFLEDRFGDDTGNLYKPEGPGGALTVFVQDTFEKKTNEEEADFSDIIHFIDVLNASYGNPWEFKTAIEQELDVGSFLDWLAVNSVLCNLDSYAGMSHNYYLYNDPVTGLFHFIPWDLNLSFGTFKGSLDADTMPEWNILHPVDKGYKPLITRILIVPVYMDAYKLKVRSLLDGPLLNDNIHPRIDFLHELARPYVIGPEGEQMPYTVLNNPDDFDINIDDDIPPFGPKRILGLKSFLADRRAYIDTIIP